MNSLTLTGINQDDMQERNLQVRLMTEIYSSAFRTLIWLGEETPDVNDSFESISTARSFLPAESGGPAIINADFDRTALATSHWDTEKSEELNLHRINWRSIVKLLERPWFQRKWIIQEIVKSRERLIICGTRQLPWVILSDLMLWLSVLNLTFFSNLIQPLPTIGMKNALTTSWPDKLFTLSELLSLTTTFFCSDDRDNIIALLGLASDVSDKDIVHLADYSLLPVELYQRYAQWLLSSKQSIDFLYCGFDPVTRQVMDIPTWLPYIGPQHDCLKHNLPPVEFSFLYNAAKDMEPQAAIKSDNRTLKIWGKTLDTIDCLTSVYTIDSLDQSNSMENARVHANILFTWLKECETIASSDQTSLPLDKTEEFWRTLCLDRETDRKRATPGFASVISRYLSLIQGGWRDLNEKGLEEWMTLCSRISIILVALRERRFCRTIAERLGVVDAGARAGDRICMFFGGRILFVVRPVGDGSCDFVGIAYLHGFMDGEAVDREDILEEEFILV